MFKYFSIFKENFYMEQELNFTLQFILFALTGLTGIAVLIFALRKKDNTPFDWEAFERTVKLIHDQTDANLDMLTKMNKQKDKIRIFSTETLQWEGKRRMIKIVF